VKQKERFHVQRIKDRGHYDRETAYAILDSAFIAHVGFSSGGQPFVIPMLYVRRDDSLILHGSIASRLLKDVGAGIETCATVTIVDGLVLARSHFHHSVNYRSVVAFGKAHVIDDKNDKLSALHHFVEAMLPGRAAESREPDKNELAATSVLRLDIVDVSAKIRSGGAKDDKADLALPHWAGVVPMRTVYETPLPSDDVSVDLPASVQRLFKASSAEA
jgi:uncharacterized protein